MAIPFPWLWESIFLWQGMWRYQPAHRRRTWRCVTGCQSGFCHGWCAPVCRYYIVSRIYHIGCSCRYWIVVIHYCTFSLDMSSFHLTYCFFNHVHNNCLIVITRLMVAYWYNDSFYVDLIFSCMIIMLYDCMPWFTRTFARTIEWLVVGLL